MVNKLSQCGGLVKEAKETLAKEEIFYQKVINKKSGETKTALSVLGAAEYLRKKFHCISIGETRPEFYVYLDGYYQKGQAIILSHLQEIAAPHLSNAIVKDILGHLHRMTLKERSTIYSAPKHLINLDNGILNLSTRELEPHTPNIIFTQRVPLNFNKNATCPKFEAYLGRLLSVQDIVTLQEFLGILLLRTYWHKKAAIFVGPTDSGKTTLINIIVSIIGATNVSGISLHDICVNRFASAALEHKLLNVYDDLSQRDIHDIGAFKVATGDGLVSAEKKFGEHYQFTNHAKLLFATNKISGVKDADDLAYYGR